MTSTSNPGSRQVRSQRGIQWLVATYAAVSALWILLSDRLVTGLFVDAPWQARAQTAKGWLFVVVTAALLYAVLRRMQAARDAAQARESAALREQARSAQLLQALVDHSTDAIFAKDEAGRYLLFNRAAGRLTGRDPAAVLGHDDAALFPADQAAMIRANDAAVMAQAEARAFEEELDTARGRLIFLATKGPLQGPDGVRGMFGISRDVTAMAQAQRALADRERRYRSLFESHPQPVWVFDLRTQRFLDVNAAAVVHYGYTRDEFLAMTLADIRPPEHRAALALDLAERQPGVHYGRSVSGPWVHRRKDGSLIEVEIAANDIEVDGHHARLVLALDVTERQRLLAERDAVTAERALAFDALSRREAELARSEQRYRLAAMGGHVWDWDVAAGRAEFPASFWQRLGLALPEGHHPEDFFAGLLHPQDLPHWQAALHAHLTLRQPYDLEYRISDAAGAWRWFHTHGHAVWDAEGHATYMAGTTFEVTDRHAAEDGLRRAQQALSGLAHRLLTQERETTTRLAHALHDQLGQTLGGARLQLDLAMARLDGADAKGAERLQRVSALLDAAITDVRSLLVELRPPLLRERGLAAALDNELQRGLGAAAGPALHLQASPAAVAARWPDDVEYAIFMIAREALANALRHAGAHGVVLRLEGDGSTLTFSLCDDGRGIADSELEGRAGHLGLLGMRERAAAIGARVDLHRRHEGGTEVLVAWEGPRP